MCDERVTAALGVVPGREPQRDASAGLGYELVRRALDPRSVEAQHGDRRLRQQPVGDRARAEQLHGVEHSGLLPEFILGHLHARPGEGVQPFDRDVAVLVVQRGDHAAQRGDRIGDRPAVGAAVLGDRQDAHGDDAVGDAPHARADRGHTGAVVAAVGHDRDVGAQQIALAADQFGEVLGGAFLLALDEDLHGDRERAPSWTPRARSAAAWIAMPALSSAAPRPYRRPCRISGSNGGRLPVGGFALGLHVVVGVQQQGGRALGAGTRVDGGMARVLAARELDQANLGHAGGAKDLGGGLGAGANVRRVVARIPIEGMRMSRSRSAIIWSRSASMRPRRVVVSMAGKPSAEFRT